MSTTEPALSSTETPAAVSIRRNVERDIVLVTSLGHFLCHLGETLYSAMLVVWMIEFQLSEYWSTNLPQVGIFLLGAGALPVSVWAHLWGPTRVFRIYFFALAAAGILVALSSTVWMLFASLTLLGMAVSIYHPVGLTLLSLGTKASRGRAMGINGVAGNVGIALGPAPGNSCVIWASGVVRT